MERAIFFEMKEECKVSCVEIIVCSIVVQQGTNILIFYIFEYGAEYGAECSAESSAKKYFILGNSILYPSLTGFSTFGNHMLMIHSQLPMKYQLIMSFNT